jgi:uncharacterized membrane protein
MDDRQPPPHPQPRSDFFQDGPHHGHDGWWPLHFLFLLLFIALIIVAAVWLLRRLAPGVAQSTAVAPAAAAAAAPGADPAVATLRMRYAKGEVSREDFQHALADLAGAEAPTGNWPAADAGDEAPAP